MNRIIAGASSLARIAQAAFVGVFALLCATSGLFAMPPLDRDEARFAQATAQMLESGDFINIRFQEAERNKKPAGVYWLQAASVHAVSTVESREIWAYRLPSVIAAVIAALCTYIAGARLYNPTVGFYAGLLLAAAPVVAAEGAIAKTDASLLACVAAAQAAFVFINARYRSGEAKGVFWPAMFWCAIAAGILIKGPIIVMVCGFTAAAFFFRERSVKWLSRFRPLMGAVILAIIVGPWAWAIHNATEGRFFIEAVGGDMVAKIGAAQESHGGPPGYYLVLIWALFWPAAALILPGLRQAIATRKAWPSFFLLAWLIPSWLVFELTATKLPHYTLPLYPALAIMAARTVEHGSALRWGITRKLGGSVFSIIGAVIAAAIILLQREYSSAGVHAGVITVALAIAAASFVAGVLLWRGAARIGTATAVMTSATLAFTLLNFTLPGLDRLMLSPRVNEIVIASRLHAIRNAAAPSVVAGYYEPSAVFLLGTKTVLTNGAGAARELAAAPGRAIIVERREEAAFLSSLESMNLAAHVIGHIDGLNYSNGDHTALTIYTAASDMARE